MRRSFSTPALGHSDRLHAPPNGVDVERGLGKADVVSGLYANFFNPSASVFARFSRLCSAASVGSGDAFRFLDRDCAAICTSTEGVTSCSSSMLSLDVAPMSGSRGRLALNACEVPGTSIALSRDIVFPRHRGGVVDSNGELDESSPSVAYRSGRDEAMNTSPAETWLSPGREGDVGELDRSRFRRSGENTATLPGEDTALERAPAGEVRQGASPKLSLTGEISS